MSCSSYVDLFTLSCHKIFLKVKLTATVYVEMDEQATRSSKHFLQIVGKSN